MSKFTPGPWKVSKHDDNGDIVVRDGNSAFGNIIANCESDYQIEPRNEKRELEKINANANLIAAAPELLEALKGLYEHCAMVHNIWGEGCNQKEADAAIKAGKAAIAKAEGREL